MSEKQAAILLGGKGTRIQSLYSDRPKALVPVCGRPILIWQLEWLKMNGFTHVHLAAGFMADVLKQWLEENPVEDLTVTVSIEENPLGTGGGTKFIEPWLVSDEVTILNGDSMAPNMVFQGLEKSDLEFPIVGKNESEFSNRWKKPKPNFQSLENLEAEFPGVGKLTGPCRDAWQALVNAQNNTPLMTMAVTPIEKTGRYGTVEFDDHHFLTAFREKADHDRGWINAGIYVMKREIFSLMPEVAPFSLEQDLFPALAALGKIRVIPSDPPLLDMGTPDGLARMEAFFAADQ